MKLPSLPFLEKKEKIDYFLALVLRNEKATAVIFEEIRGKVRVIGKHEVAFSAPIETVSPEELLDSLDKAISSAESKLPENVETQKTVFGVKENWVEEGRIKKEYLAKLKKISEELNLSPIGFLTISEAISHYLQKEEGAPVSAILVEIGKNTITLSLIRAGKVIETRTADITESVPHTADTLLKHFTASDIFPSRLLIFDGDETLNQEFVSFHWSKTLPFLHMPQVKTLTPGLDAKAILDGAATQMGFEILHDTSILEKEEKPVLHMDEETLEMPTPTRIHETHEQTSTHTFGFLKDTDIAAKKEMQTDEDLPKINDSSTHRSDLFHDNIEEIPDEMLAEAESESLPANGMMVADGGRKVFASLTKAMKKFSFGKIPSLPFLKSGKKVMLLPIFGIVIICFIAYYFFGLSANVVLQIQPKTITQDETITFSTTSATNKNDKIIASNFLTVSENDTDTTVATGTKEIGNPAKGTVTIFSQLTTDKTIPQGTIIKASNGVTFALDNNVTVNAVASHSADQASSPSTVTSSATATAIGTESNLPSATKFTVGSFDSGDIVAKNDVAFSGGSKKTVTVVSKDDEDKLLAELPKNLQSKATDELQKQTTSDKTLLNTFTDISFDKKTFDTGVGQPANQVTLSATVTYQTISYSKKDMSGFAATLLQDSIPGNVMIHPNDVQVSVKDMKKKNDNDVLANVTISAKLLPKIQPQELASQIAGKSFDDAKTILDKIPEVGDALITFSPNIPIFPKILPRISSHIHISANQ